MSDNVEIRTTSLGEAAEQVFVYEPVSPNIDSAPVIVFLHGYTGVNPLVYGAWIEHLVRRGNIVLYPVYQATLVNADTYTDNALAGVIAAFDMLRNESGHVAPEENHFAMIGHSMGGVLSMNLAAIVEDHGLPPVKAVLAANAGDVYDLVPGLPGIQTDNYDQIPDAMLFLGIVGIDDTTAGEDTVLSLYNNIPQIPTEIREVVLMTSDRHGRPMLVADHESPLAVNMDFDSGGPAALTIGGEVDEDRIPTAEETVDAQDYYGYWKWSDALTDAAFYGQHREYALGGSPEQLHMGVWSDGIAVLPAERMRPVPEEAAE